MKIRRIQRIRGHRIYRDFTWPGALPDFARFNVLYGWNGSGKTTLSNLLRHLQIKQPVAEGEIQYLIDERTVHHHELDRAHLPPVRVFNRDSVDRTVFEVPGKQFSPIYYLGEDSVEKQKEIERLKEQLEGVKKDTVAWGEKKASNERDREALCAAEAKAIKNLLTVAGGGRYNNYDSRDFKTAITILEKKDEQPRALTEDEISQFLAAKDAKVKEIIPTVHSGLPDLLTLTSEVNALLRRSVISNAIDELVKNPELAKWISQGLQYHLPHVDSQLCRFCEQPLTASRLEQLNGHFNDQFKRFIRDLDIEIEKVTAIQQQIEKLRPPEKVLFYEHLWARYEKAVATFDQQRGATKLYFDAVLRALNRKKEQPFESFDLLSSLSSLKPDSNAGWLEKILDSLSTGSITIAAKWGNDAAQEINALINEHNQHTNNFQQTLSEARKNLETSQLLAAFPRYRQYSDSIAEAQEHASRAASLVQEIEQKISELERAIRQHQRPAEELNADLQSYLGRSELQFEVKDSGYSVTRRGKPAMHLSEGERTAIAFMYFLKSLRDVTFDIQSGVVVIDDPVSSLDANSLYSAFGFLKDRTRDAGQLFILTHNFGFFRQVRNWFYNLPNQRKKDIALQPARFYMITTATLDGERCATIQLLDELLHRFESEYHYLFKRVYEEAHKPAGASLEEQYGVSNIARRLLESFLAFRFPGSSGELYQQLEQVDFDSAKKTRILRFLHTHSHRDHVAEPEHDLSLLAEAKSVLLDLLALMHEVDPKHYEGMVSITSAGQDQENAAAQVRAA